MKEHRRRVAVEGALVWACLRFREKPGQPMPKQVHGHTVLEVSWTIAFAVILLIIGIPTIQMIFKTQEPEAASALRVDVAGRQWWWEWMYSFFTAVLDGTLSMYQESGLARYAGRVEGAMRRKLRDRNNIVPAMRKAAA